MKHIFKQNRQIGASMIEFSVTIFIFFIVIFSIFEIGLVILTRTGLEAGKFYSMRAGITGDYNNQQIRDTFIEYANKYAKVDKQKIIFNIERYRNLAQLFRNTNSSSQQGNISDAVYLYDISYSYQYNIVNLLNSSTNTKNIMMKSAVWNENF